MTLPIRVRLTLVYCATFLGVIFALEAGTYFSARSALQSIVDRELETRLAGLDDHLTRHIDKYTWPRLRASLAEHPAFQPAQFYVRRVDGEILFQGLSMKGDAVAPPFGPELRLATVTTGGGVLRVLRVRRIIQGQPYDLALATDLQMPAAILRYLWLGILVSGPIILLIASAAGYWIAGRALEPIARMIHAAKSIDSTNLSHRVDVPQSGDEVQLLAETINRMLVRIEDGFRQIQQFTANAAHELRTPVAILRASAEITLLRSRQPERTYRDALHRILRESERTSVLLGSLLQLARLDAGSDCPPRMWVALDQSVAAACRELTPLAESHGLRITMRAEAQGAYVLAAEDHLRRLWFAFLENAIRYTPSGGQVTVTVRLAPSGLFCCTFSDTGIGIASEHLPKLFDRFYRVDKARNRADGGCGLGLAIATELAALYGAVIEVDSQPGVGSNFHVLIPASAGELRAVETPDTVTVG